MSDVLKPGDKDVVSKLIALAQKKEIVEVNLSGNRDVLSGILKLRNRTVKLDLPGSPTPSLVASLQEVEAKLFFDEIRVLRGRERKETEALFKKASA